MRHLWQVGQTLLAAIKSCMFVFWFILCVRVDGQVVVAHPSRHLHVAQTAAPVENCPLMNELSHACDGLKAWCQQGHMHAALQIGPYPSWWSAVHEALASPWGNGGMTRHFDNR